MPFESLSRPLRGYLLGALVLALAYGAIAAGEPFALKTVWKTLPVTILAVIAWRHGAPKAFALGLGFGALGDLALSLAPPVFFLIGMGAFFIGHICYASAFRRDLLPSGEAKGRWVIVAILAAAGLYLPASLANQLGEMELAVEAYSAMILLTAGIAIRARTGQPFAMLGMLSFVVSDGMIALGRFGGVDGLSLFIWYSYVAAQVMILAAALEHRKISQP